jgi:hypothetical protein
MRSDLLLMFRASRFWQWWAGSGVIQSRQCSPSTQSGGPANPMCNKSAFAGKQIQRLLSLWYQIINKR